MPRFYLRPSSAMFWSFILLCLPAAAQARQGAAPFSENGAGAAASAVEAYFIPARDGLALAALADARSRTEGMPHQFADPIAVSITPQTHGTWESLPGGGRLWRLLVQAPGATDLNLGFGRYDLPAGATLHVIAEGRGYWEGPYTYEDNASHGQLWLPVVPGDRAMIELYVPAEAKYEPVLELVHVGYGFRDWFRLSGPTPRQGACNNDVICPEGDPWRDDIAAAAVYQRSGAWTCSGQMVNNTAGDFTPYFLTANHCGVNSGNAATMVVYWNFESPVCGNLCCGSLADNQTGAFFRSASAPSDFTLVELDEDPNPAFGVYFAGWDASGATPTNVAGIHHPSTDEKAISFDNNASQITSYLGNTSPGDGTHWKIVNWEDGITEPGSSGSGIWNQNHRLVGQLHGGTSSCSLPNDPDWYGRVSVSWLGGGSAASQLKAWLDPGNTGALTLDGSYTAPILRYASHDGTDDCPGGAGDGNTVWEPGEQVVIPVTIGAVGGAFTSVQGTLSSTSLGVTILDGSATWPNIASGGSAATNAPHFKIAVAPSVACGTVLNLEVSVTTAEGGPYVFPFTHEVGQALTPGGLPASIPDASPGGVTSTLAVGQNVSLTDVNCRVEITHSWVGDLKIELESPLGTRITLLDRPGVPTTTFGCNNDNMDVTFDSASGVNLETHCASTTPWYSGVGAPFASLNAFNGQSSLGNWKLIVTDGASQDTGTLVDWELITTPALSGVCDPCAAATETQIAATAAASFGLAPIRPNPFAASAEVAFTLERAGRAQLEIIDVTGRRVARLADGDMAAGPHTLAWDGRDATGNAVAAGTYFVRLVSGGRQDLERIVRLR